MRRGVAKISSSFSLAQSPVEIFQGRFPVANRACRFSRPIPRRQRLAEIWRRRFAGGESALKNFKGVWPVANRACRFSEASGASQTAFAESAKRLAQETGRRAVWRDRRGGSRRRRRTSAGKGRERIVAGTSACSRPLDRNAPKFVKNFFQLPL